MRVEVRGDVDLVAVAEGGRALVEHRLFLVEVIAGWGGGYVPSAWRVGKRSCFGKVNMALALEVLSGDLLLAYTLSFDSFVPSIFLLNNTNRIHDLD